MDTSECRSKWNKLISTNQIPQNFQQCVGISLNDYNITTTDGYPKCHLIGQKKLSKYKFTWNAENYNGIENFSKMINLTTRHNLCKCIIGVAYLGVSSENIDTEYTMRVLKMQEISILIMNALHSDWILRLYLDNTLFTNFEHFISPEKEIFRNIRS